MTSEYLDYLRLPVNISSKFFERRTQGAQLLQRVPIAMVSLMPLNSEQKLSRCRIDYELRSSSFDQRCRNRLMNAWRFFLELQRLQANFHHQFIAFFSQCRDKKTLFHRVRSSGPGQGNRSRLHNEEHEEPGTLVNICEQQNSSVVNGTYGCLPPNSSIDVPKQVAQIC